MMGTPDYMAPEQALDAAATDIRADVYSLGCTLYYLLAGRPPFTAASLLLLLQSHQTVEAKPLNLDRPEVPAELAGVVAKMMAKDPGRRFQTPGDVARALAPFVKPGAAHRPGPELSRGTAETGRPAGAIPVRPAQAATAPEAKPDAMATVLNPPGRCGTRSRT